MTINIESINKSSFFTDTEKIILNKMLYWENRGNDSAFILINEGGLIELNAHKLFSAINHLVNLRILRKRNCEAIAYEWDNKEELFNYL